MSQVGRHQTRSGVLGIRIVPQVTLISYVNDALWSKLRSENAIFRIFIFVTLTDGSMDKSMDEPMDLREHIQTSPGGQLDASPGGFSLMVTDIQTDIRTDGQTLF